MEEHWEDGGCEKCGGGVRNELKVSELNNRVKESA